MNALVKGILYVLVSVLGSAAFAADPDEIASDPAGQVYFGDLHIHSSYSFDAFGLGDRRDPAQAYEATKPLLDFAAVTDHAEFLGETDLCSTPGAPGFDTAICRRLRIGDPTVFADLAELCLNDPPRVDPEICAATTAEVWERIKAAADANYAPGEFTTFIGYEYSRELSGERKLHRNVIFSGSDVPAPVPRSEESDPAGLWKSLKRNCVPANGCDSVVIPHTMNASRGKYFSIYDGNGHFIPVSQASLRGDMERIVEIYQNKGNSECYFNVNTSDEGCQFEKLPPVRVTELGGGEIPRQSWAREALKLGLVYEETFGVNPYQFGFIGGTDNHNSIGGKVSEDGYVGNFGAYDDTVLERMGSDVSAAYSPGGLAAVWANRNNRESIFAALKRREVYATSGTRIVARFFGGWTLPANLCDSPQLVPIAYEQGVPMGSVLPPRTTQKPVFVVVAQRDPASTGLKKIQMIKGWQQNEQLEQVLTLVETSVPSDSMCTVWQDDSFDPTLHAFYYARIVEAPTPRWSAYDCVAAGVDCDVGAPPGLERCCDGTVPMSVAERAWTSPIWYVP